MPQPFHAVPGTVVQFEGELFLVEKVSVRLIMQRLESRATPDPVYGHAHNTAPVFQSLEDEIGGETLSKIIPLIPMETTIDPR